MCLRQYQIQEYEDDRLGAHAKELLAAITKELGEADDDDREEDGDEWEDEEESSEDEDEDEDEDMAG